MILMYEDFVNEFMNPVSIYNGKIKKAKLKLENAKTDKERIKYEKRIAKLKKQKKKYGNTSVMVV